MFACQGFNHLKDECTCKVEKREEKREEKKRGLCFFFFRREGGCKKKDNCEYSHDPSSSDLTVRKVRKLCDNGPTCTWKPCCRYVHPEDGEVIPPRREEGGRRSRGEEQEREVRGSRGQGRLQYSVGGGWTRVPDMGFQVDLTRPPPGYLRQQIPHINSLGHFPVLKTKTTTVLSNTM